jgi:hypothetical protein
MPLLVSVVFSLLDGLINPSSIFTSSLHYRLMFFFITQDLRVTNKEVVTPSNIQVAHPALAMKTRALLVNSSVLTKPRRHLVDRNLSVFSLKEIVAAIKADKIEVS